MLNNFSIDPALLRAVIAIIVTIISFCTYLLISGSDRVNKWVGGRFDEDRISIRRILFRRIFGGAIFIILPLLTILVVFRQPLAAYGLTIQGHNRSVYWLIPMVIAIVIFNYFICRWSKNLAVYPQIRRNRWSVGLFSSSAGGWIIYLTGYEFMFRGLLLFACFEAFGYWPAIGINLLIYSLAHIPKGPEEMIGSLILGSILCVLTLELGNLWFAIYAHSLFALVNEWFSLAYQPEMHLIRSDRGR